MKREAFGQQTLSNEHFLICRYVYFGCGAWTSGLKFLCASMNLQTNSQKSTQKDEQPAKGP